MSIVNRYSPNKSINPKNIFTENQKLHWTIIFYKPELVGSNNEQTNELLKYFYEVTIASLSKEIEIEHIYIYLNSESSNKGWFSSISSFPNVFLVDIPRTVETNTTKFLIIQKFMDDRKNVILLEHGHGYININNNTLSIDRSPSIYSTFIDTTEMDDIYLPIIQKFNLHEIIKPDVIIIPYSQKNRSYIVDCFKLASKLRTDNENFVTNISLTITNLKYGNIVMKIKDTAFGENFVSYINDKNTINLLKELFATKSERPIWTEKELVPYDNDRYTYYPYFDLDADKTKIINNYLDSEPKIRNQMLTDRTINPMPDIFNTNGFSMDVKTDEAIYPSMFKRFGDKTSGVFIKKKTGPIVIPKIVHHVWHNEEPVKNYTNAWGRILKEPWTYMIWTHDDAKNNVIGDTKWSKIYNGETDKNIQQLISNLAILEKYGGVLVDSFTLPLKIIPDDILDKKFMLSFADERNSGTKLSYRIMASVPGKFKDDPIIENSGDPARKPFEGTNNFFRLVKYINDKKKSEQLNMAQNHAKNQTVTNPKIFENFYQILSEENGENKISQMDKMLISDPSVAIYPSYYFNPSSYLFPKKLTKCAICINLWKTITNEVPPKTDIKRIYKINPAGIIAKLNENPRDRLKNTNQLNIN